MGFLTPFLIKNDIAHLFKEKKLRKEICDKLYCAMVSGKKQVISIDNYCNYIESLGSKHAEITRVIIVNGNTWVDVDKEIYNSDNKNRINNKERITFLNKLLNILNNEVDFIKSEIKELRENGKIVKKINIKI